VATGNRIADTSSTAGANLNRPGNSAELACDATAVSTGIASTLTPKNLKCHVDGVLWRLPTVNRLTEWKINRAEVVNA
jgi:hypothetical protein